MTSQTDLAALLCSRLCHDLLSPVGAMSNGLELLAEEQDPEMRKRCVELLEQSARISSDKLRFFRLAFGAAGGFGDAALFGRADGADNGGADRLQPLAEQHADAASGRLQYAAGAGRLLQAAGSANAGDLLDSFSEAGLRNGLSGEARALYLDEAEPSVDGQGPVEKALEVLARGGKLSQADYLRCKVRYFSDGAVIGGKAFVDEMFSAFRDRFGPKRKVGARPLRGLAGDTKEGRLFNFRQLRKGVFG
jgi:hypothetical protein